MFLSPQTAGFSGSFTGIFAGVLTGMHESVNLAEIKSRRPPEL